MSATTNTSGSTRPAAPRNRTHYLYVAVIVAVGLGIAVGLLAPSFAVELKPLGQAFVALIKMMIQPVIFCTIVLGVGSVASAARVGKVGGLALVYFVTMSTFALAIGLVVGNILHPGDGLQLTGELAGAGQEQAAAGHGSTTEFLLGHHPDRRCSPRSPRARCCRRCWSRCWSASRSSRWAAPASRCCAASGTSSGVVFRVLSMIMWAAPVGAFGAIAAVVGETGADALKSLAVLMFGFYVTCALFVFVVLGTLLKLTHRRQHLQRCSATWPASSC